MSVSFTAEGERRVFSGGDATTQDWLQQQIETTTGSYVILDSAIGASVLQSTRLDAGMFARQGVLPGLANNLAYILTGAGVFTAADALTLGLEKIRRATNWEGGRAASARYGLNARRETLLKQALLSLGWPLPAGNSFSRTEDYYDDIRLASPAIALPYGDCRYYRDLKLGNERAVSIGRLLAAPEIAVEREYFFDYKPPQERERLHDFIRQLGDVVSQKTGAGPSV